MTDENPEADIQPEPPADAAETDADETVAEEAVVEEQASPEETPATEMPATEAPAGETESVVVGDAEEPQLDIGSSAEEAETGPKQAAVIRGRVDKHGVAMGTGRRKTAVARVRISDGEGKLTVNGREFTEYFPLERDRQMIKAPLQATNSLEKLDVWVRVKGGGSTGQTGAVVLGIARALQVKDPDLHEKLSEGGYLTRDGRMVERKKYGLRKARRSFQFSKR